MNFPLEAIWYKSQVQITCSYYAEQVNAPCLPLPKTLFTPIPSPLHTENQKKYMAYSFPNDLLHVPNQKTPVVRKGAYSS